MKQRLILTVALAISVTFNVGLMAGAARATQPSPFRDIANHPFRTHIESLWHAGITGGCAPDRYCPDAYVTRGQMAAFLKRALDLP